MFSSSAKSDFVHTTYLRGFSSTASLEMKIAGEVVALVVLLPVTTDSANARARLPIQDGPRSEGETN